MTKGINESIDQNSAKYNIVATFTVQGVVEVQDVVGALFGQTEGLLDSLELRELQKTGRIGRIVVNATSDKGVTTGEIIIPSSLDRTETAILAATLETVDRVGPCRATLQLQEIKDLRQSKLAQIEARAKELLMDWKADSADRNSISDKINIELERESVITWKGLPAGNEIEEASSVIIVEGRNDIQQLLKIGVKNTVAVNGTSIPKAIIDLTHEKECTAFLDGDRGGEMILNELLQVSKIKYFARAPLNREVEELMPKDLVKCLQNKRPVEELFKERRMKDEKVSVDREQQKTVTHHKSTRQSSSRSPAGPQRNYKERSPRSHKDSRSPRSPRQERKPRTHGREHISRATVNIPKEKISPLVKNLISSNEAIGLDSEFNEILRTSNVNIFEDLTKNPQTVVMDGVITQRFLDEAIDNKVKTVVAVNINRNLKVKDTNAIELYYFNDFL